MKTTAMLMIVAFISSALSLEVKDASTPGGGTPGSPACGRQCLITISPVGGASTQRSDGFPGSCKEYATGQLKGINRSVDGGRLNINGVGGNLVIDFVVAIAVLPSPISLSVFVCLQGPSSEKTKPVMYLGF
ncbi:uncharacterized protein FTJAE_770 [Fusarium tjaetaba]|uniref:Uncharacterized protein n=1 Tax=Fusarium tjaetaba TaxID=1567544 RepID=A0A8H5SFT0_9HYPO|nr:uncharacterized protein FTJAE_770 [Fusarium tjaetaba]KAF5649806.1 hypothetical protein FTJAE_770 [Fusarium tjaetaba]